MELRQSRNGRSNWWIMATGAALAMSAAAAGQQPSSEPADRVVSPATPSPAAPAQPAPAADESGAIYQKYAVAADHALASKAGATILRAGGNAVDAAVATSFALSVVRPFSCGIGGGGFMVISLPENVPPPSGTVPPALSKPRTVLNVCINYREMCPKAVGPEYFEKLDENASIQGGKACAVPGTVAGLLHALEKYGSMSRAEVMAPAIVLAREGFVADKAYVEAARGMIEKFEKNAGLKARFAFTWDRFLGSGKVEVGQRITLPEQAAVLEKIAAQGVDGFYKGEVGEAIIAAIRASGGEMTMDDLGAFRVTEAAPLRTDIALRTMLMMPPPSSGGLAMAEIFGIVDRLRIGEHVQSKNWGVYYHVLIEAFKHAFADRAKFLGDPAFVDVPVERLMSKEYLDSLSKRVRIAKTGTAEAYGTIEPLREDGGTSHLCVVDRWGGAVACTETINLPFGSLVSSDRLGFCVNNEMDDFTTRSGAANAFGLRQSDRNRPAPGKRPLSSMSPTVVLDRDGKVRAVAGASGGPRIITATVQTLLNTLVRGEDAVTAVRHPRVHHQWKPETLEIEEGLSERHDGLGVDMWMRKLGHIVKPASEHAAVQLIVMRGKRWEAACDPRKGGRPDGE